MFVLLVELLLLLVVVLCGAGHLDPKCGLSPDTGSCNDLSVRWHYNATANVCMPFVYSGCGGNDNNFVDEEPCLLSCAKFDEDPCSAPLEQGFGDQTLIRWYFNAGTEQCEKFVYNGRGGTLNNFVTEDDCQTLCSSRFVNSSVASDEVSVCSQPKQRGPCTKLWLRWWHDNATNQCTQFVYGGCDGNRNNFLTKEVCESRCVATEVDICKLPLQQGPCSASLIRWHFNSQTDQCEKFIYGGCEGNDNNFESKEACEKRCAVASLPPETVADNLCRLPPKRGPCSDAVLRWHFDSDNGVCRPFIYGGCEGNENNFQSAAQCLNVCLSSAKPTTSSTAQPITTAAANLCTLDADQGPCDLQLIRWYYNGRMGQCEKFIYGGCKGNANNFVNKEQCEEVCVPTPIGLPLKAADDVCRMPVDQGPCTGVHFRWYYNAATGACEKFIYGGCGGNANNFVSLPDCQRQCAPAVQPQPAVVALPSPLVALRQWRFDPRLGCYVDDAWCSSNAAFCFRSKLECLEKWAPRDGNAGQPAVRSSVVRSRWFLPNSALCLSLPEGFHMFHDRTACSSQFYSCLGGHFVAHSCPEPLKFDIVSHHCLPRQQVAACRV